MKKIFKQDKGVAGLTILLSLIVMLFVIGLLVMIFSIMGSKLQDSTYTAGTGSANNQTVTTLSNTTGDVLVTQRNCVATIVIVTNETSGATVPATNYTTSGCTLYGTYDTAYLGRNVNVSYTYTYDADNTATDVMNATTSSVASVTDWFDIFIVIGAMVVLILLTVVIITAIRSSGMVDGSGQGANQVGTA